MNILLTGGTGYIGSHTAAVLCEAGHNVTLLDNQSNSSGDILDQLEQIVGNRPDLVVADVRDTEHIREALRTHEIGAVIHFAGLKAVGESVRDPLEYYANNVQGTISLLQAMKDIGVRRLVFSSSATVYGEPEYLPIDEQHPLRATSPYGRSKLHVEGMLEDLAASDPSWEIAGLRYFNPVGAHESGLIGENPNGVPNNLMPYVAQVAAGRRPELSVFGNDYPTRDGTGVRDYIHVMDLAEGHANALAFLQGHPGYHAVNLGTGYGYSVLELVEAYKRASNRPIPYHVGPRRPGDVVECYADPTKAREVFGWTARRTLEEMCASSWRFQESLFAGID